MAGLTMDKLVALCKNRGFIFAGSEIYGGLANTWDYGPLGVEFKNNVKKAWWKKFVQESPYNAGLDCAILMNREVWVASGHVGGFNDPLMDCKACKARFRADKLIEDYTQGAETGDGWTQRRAGGLHRRARHRLPDLRQEGFHRHPPVQPDVQDPSGRDRGLHQRDLSAPRDGAGHLRQLPERPCAPRARSCPPASARSASPSATRSRPATSSSACANSSRWSWSSSASPARIWSGSSTGAPSAATGCCPWA